MIYSIRKGKHRARPLYIRLWKEKSSIEKDITFNESCIYNISDISIHKLFGLGYLFNHHVDSARVGWRYEGGGIFKLFSYCYISGKRVVQEICTVPINTKINCKISIINKKYIFRVYYNSSPLSIVIVNFSHNKKWSYPLNFYYGGRLSASRDINIKIENNV